MKRVFFFSIILVLLVSCAPTTGSPSVEPTKGFTSTPLPITQTPPISTLQATSTTEPMMFKVAEFGRGYIFDHALSPDGKIMAIASSSGLYLYDVQTQKIIKYIKSEKEDIDEVVFSSNGDYLAYHGNKIRLLDLKNNEIALETNEVYHTNFIGFNPDNNFLLFTPLTMAARGGLCVSHIEIWDIEKKIKIFSHEPPEDLSYDYDLPCPKLSSVAFNEDDAIVYAGYGGGIVAWEMSSGKQLFYTPTYSGFVTDLFYDPGLDIVVTGDSGGALRYWNAKTGKNVKTLGITDSGITSIQFSDDKTKLVLETEKQSVTLVDYKTGKLLGNTQNGINDKEFTNMADKLYNDGFFALNNFEFYFGEYTRSKKIAYSGGGSKIATDCTIIDAHDTKTILILPSCDWEYRYGEMAYSKTGKYIAEGDNWGELKLWNAMSGKLIMNKPDLGYINTLAFSESENLLAVGTDYVLIWDTQNNRLVKNLYPGTGRVEYVRFRDQDQTLIAVTVPDYLISVFDIESGQLLNLIRPPLPEDFYVYSSVAAQGDYLASNGTVWNMETNSIIKTTSSSFIYDWLPIFSPDGRIYTEVRDGGVIFFIDMKTQKIIYTFNSGFGVNPIFSPNGKHIAFIAPGGTIQIWDISRIVELASP